MRFFAVLLSLGVLFCPVTWMRLAAQSSDQGSGLIESRQAEVTQLGLLMYRVHLDDGQWTHQPAAVCPAFKHYTFARYDRKGSSENPTSFLAIYPLGHAPAKSLKRPWEGGILLQPVAGMRPDPDVAVAEQDQTVQIFNRIWADELKRSGQHGAFPGLTWAGLADCYARFANEEPLSAGADESTAPPVDLNGTAVNGILIPLRATSANGTMDRSLVLSFDKHGLIVDTHISTSPHVSPPAQ